MLRGWTGRGRDLHRALKSDVVGRANSNDPSLELVIARMQYGKDEHAVGLHVRPSSYSSSGIQTTDLLALLGFQRDECGIFRGECYSAQVAPDFDVQRFASTIGQVFRAVEQADRHLSACGFFLPRTEGWGYFYGQPSSGAGVAEEYGGGDGHTGVKIEAMKRSEDDIFRFAFTWREADGERGWVTHYQPKHPPLAEDVSAALALLRLRNFDGCPEFDFEPCWWRYSPRNGNEILAAEGPHRAFDAHAQNFSAGLKQLVVAHEHVVPLGLRLLPAPAAPARSAPARATPSRATSTPAPSGAPTRAASDPRYKYDVAISFAGPQREIAQVLATAVRDAGFRVFFDGFYPEHLWGKDLTVFFDEVFRKDSRFCVMLVSKKYVERIWTTHERRSALARALAERGNEYILPIQVESAEVPGLLPTIGYVALEGRSVKDIAELLKKKLAMK